MHILYIFQYFATPKGNTTTRSYEFARRWVLAGHKVTMLTTTAQLTREEIEETKGRFIKKIVVEGIDVHAFKIPYSQKMGFIGRCISFLGFAFFSLYFVIFKKNVDVIFATSTPLTVGIPALAAKWIRRIPYVFEVRDQWPEIPVELGIIKNKAIIKLLFWFEKTIYKFSEAIIAASPGQAEGIRKVYPKVKYLEIVPNGCDINMFSPQIIGKNIREKYGWDNKLVLLHAGAMGKVNSLKFVIDAAEILQDKVDILFVLIGQGNQKELLENRARELNLNNVQILPPMPKKDLPEIFTAADVGLVIIGNYPIIEHNSANKFFDYLSAGKPVLLNYSGWQREVIEKNEAGYGCQLCNMIDFVEKIKYLETNRSKLLHMGKKARQLAEGRFDRNKLSQEALKVIEKAFEKENRVDGYDEPY
jgi:glycosyltransferase involved in cell wall biosynthesis